jgi:hypothetical protein
MPTYQVTTTSSQFLYGSPEQLHNWVTDLPAYTSLTAIEQVDDLDLPQEATPISLGWVEILDNGGESPEAWASMARAQLDRLGVSMDVTALSESEAEGYSGNRYERFLWLGASSLKLLFPAVDLVVCLTRLTLADVEADAFWDGLYSKALGHDSCYLPTCR